MQVACKNVQNLFYTLNLRKEPWEVMGCRGEPRGEERRGVAKSRGEPRCRELLGATTSCEGLWRRKVAKGSARGKKPQWAKGCDGPQGASRAK
jgi:hypothetical protein